MSLDLDKMTDHYHKALLRVVAGLFSMAGFEPGGSIEVMQRHLRRVVMRGLLRVESATRRIIMIVERKLEPLPGVVRDRAKPSGPIPKGKGKRSRRAFPLLDPKRRGGGGSARKHPPGAGPRMFFIRYHEDPVFEAAKPAPMPDDEVSAESLRQRLEAVLDALNNPMRQARRLQRFAGKNSRANPDLADALRHAAGI